MMDKTLKDFLEYLKKTDTKVLNYDDLLTELKNTHERTFTGSLKTNMLTPKDGLISIDKFLDNLYSYEEQGHFLSDKEIKALDKDKTNYVYDDDWYTYNDDGNYLAHDINMDMFINDDGNYLVFLQVHTGADARWGFSSYIAIKFDTKDDFEDAFLYGSTEYDLGSCSIETQEGKTYTIRIISSPLDYPANMCVSDDDDFDEVFDTEIGCADLDGIKDEVNDYLSSDKELAKNFHVEEFNGYDGTVEAI